jgi:hypothetical protein
MAAQLPLSALCVARSARACVPGGGAEEKEEEEEEARASSGAHTPGHTEAGGGGGGVFNGWGGGGSPGGISSGISGIFGIGHTGTFGIGHAGGGGTGGGTEWVGGVSLPIVGEEQMGGVPGGGGGGGGGGGREEWIQGLRHWVTDTGSRHPIQGPGFALQGQGALMLTELSLINLPVGEDSLAALLLSTALPITRLDWVPCDEPCDEPTPLGEGGGGGV